MRIALAYDLRLTPAPTLPAPAAPGREHRASPDDADEEFDSPATIEALERALAAHGHQVERLGNGPEALARLLDGSRPELVFNIAEGRGAGRAREARLPAALEMLDVPYTGSDPLALAATLDKDCAKRLVGSHGVPTAPWVLVEEGGHEEARDALKALPYPVIVKPAFEGSSKGIRLDSVAAGPDQAAGLARRVHELYRQPALVEEFIAGEELTVGILGNRPPEVIGIMRIVPRERSERFLYSIEVKRDWRRLVRYECPASLGPGDAERVRLAALGAWRALGLRDVSRVDFRLRAGVPYFLEANPLPGLSPEHGDLVLLGRAMGIDHTELVGRIVEAARERIAREHGGR